MKTTILRSGIILRWDGYNLTFTDRDGQKISLSPTDQIQLVKFIEQIVEGVKVNK